MAHERLDELPVLEDWSVHKAYDPEIDQEVLILVGVIYNDMALRKKFASGHTIWTSRVLRIDGCTAQTRNTLYRLSTRYGDPRMHLAAKEIVASSMYGKFLHGNFDDGIARQ